MHADDGKRTLEMSEQSLCPLRIISTQAALTLSPFFVPDSCCPRPPTQPLLLLSWASQPIFQQHKSITSYACPSNLPLQLRVKRETLNLVPVHSTQCPDHCWAGLLSSLSEKPREGS